MKSPLPIIARMPDTYSSQQILVLGVGNTLLHDEGAGVFAITQLQAKYNFSNNVTFYDGGTQGIRLLHPIEDADFLIVADTVITDDEPGTVVRFTLEQLRNNIKPKNSLHQVDFSETLLHGELIGVLPATVIIGIVPENLSPWGTEFSAKVQEGLPKVEALLLKEISAVGGSFTQKA